MVIGISLLACFFVCLVFVCVRSSKKQEDQEEAQNLNKLKKDLEFEQARLKNNIAFYISSMDGIFDANQDKPELNETKKSHQEFKKKFEDENE